ncbi:MAG: glycogen debranching enzyme family protein [Cytophagales bacterium]|nr:glycogen debranching enzyme family protein [Armatimonadota bacterium]
MRPLDATELQPFDRAAEREWLSANGIGGFASGTVSGAATRRYHALLVAALDAPPGRMTLLGKVDETLSIQNHHFDLSANRYPNGIVFPDGWRYIAEFSPWPVPTWTYRMPGETVLVKRVFLARGKNTVYVTYTLREATSEATLTLTPLVCWKEYHAEMRPWAGFPARRGPEVGGWLVQATRDAPTLRLMARSARWTSAGWWHERLTHDRERERGLDSEEDLFCPAVAKLTLRPGQTVAFVATVEKEEPLDYTLALTEIVKHQEALAKSAKASADADDPRRLLTFAADQFVVKAQGVRTTILAGYPWFTDWGRDTMIALPGTCLSTGRFEVAREVLQTFAGYVDGGMIPNRFPDEKSEPDYNTVDATLWFVHACDRYCRVSKDTAFQETLVPILEQIIHAHLSGTRYGIRVDSEDGLLSAGERGTQLTWMDAKVGGWVVTPRQGKPVEVNALWINALRILADWKGADGGAEYGSLADRAKASFVAKFVRPDGQGLYDVIKPEGMPDGAIRPNQIIAAALPHSPLTNEQAAAVLEAVTAHLLTPYGLRTLAPSDPAYRGRYQGDTWSRDGAYHQGTAWPWLLGSFVDTYRRVHGPQADISGLVGPLLTDHLRVYGVGSISEVTDGDAPYRPDGCPFQAWSVAEILRVLSPLDTA